MTSFDVIMRSDAGNVQQIGTGHLYRSITIAKLLIKKFKIEKKKIIFITKTTGKFSLSKKILKQNKFNFYSIKANATNKDEYNAIKKFKSNLLIIDKYRTRNTKYLKKIKKNFKKIIFLDAIKYEHEDALYINSLLHRVDKKIKNIGFKYLICPSFLNKRKSIIKKKLINIFLFFGGFDNKKIMDKIMFFFNNNKEKYTLILPQSVKNKYNYFGNIKYFTNKNIFDFLAFSDLAITAGGLTMFDAINIKKPIISIPQYLHQELNIKKLDNEGCVLTLKINKNFNKNLSKHLLFMMDWGNRTAIFKNQSKILSGNKMPKSLELIYNEFKS